MSIGMLERKRYIYKVGNNKLSLYYSSKKFVLEIVKINSNLYILIQDKAKIIKNYSSKANAANKKNI